VLAQLEPSLFRTAVAQAEANVARAQAGLAQARRSYDRAKELKARNVLAQVDLDAAQAAFEQGAAELKQAQAALQNARVNLGHATIESPIDGVVIARSVDIGQTVAASLSAPTLFEIAGDLTHMQVETRIDEADIGRVRPGLKARFTVDAFPEDTFEGIVRQVRLEPTVEQGVVSYTTVVDVPNEALKLKPGMTANVTISIDKKDDVLKVANAALRFHPPEDAKTGAPQRSGEPRAAAAGTPSGGGPQGATRVQRGAGGGPAAGGARMGGGAGGGMRMQAGGGAGGAVGSGAAGGMAQTVYVLGPGDKLTRVRIRPGLTDGTSTEVVGGELTEGARVVVGLMPKKGQMLQAPPGMGGPGMRPGGGGGGGGRR
jgi:HlyD family secretion protein